MGRYRTDKLCKNERRSVRKRTLRRFFHKLRAGAKAICKREDPRRRWKNGAVEKKYSILRMNGTLFAI